MHVIPACNQHPRTGKVFVFTCIPNKIVHHFETLFYFFFHGITRLVKSSVSNTPTDTNVISAPERSHYK